MPTLAYWKIRGLAQPIRFLLTYCGEEFEDKLYECGPAPDYSRECWNKEKFTFGLDFPNLPYYLDGDVKITQSNAIFRYIARKHGLCGSTVAEQALVDMMADTVMDMRNAAIWLFYGTKAFDEGLPGYLKNLQGTLEKFSTFLASKPWLCGDKITFPDFHFYEMLKQHVALDPTCLDKFDNLKAYITRFEELPRIKAYLASYTPLPVNNPSASWKPLL